MEVSKRVTVAAASAVTAFVLGADLVSQVTAQDRPSARATFSTLSITDTSGVERIRLHADPQGGGTIQLLDDRGRTTITADSVIVSRGTTWTEITAGAIRIYDSKGACRVEVALDGDVGGRVGLNGSDEQRLAELSACPDFGALELGPAATRIRARAGTSPRAFLQLLDIGADGVSKVGVELSLKDAPEIRIDGLPVR